MLEVVNNVFKITTKVGKNMDFNVKSQAIAFEESGLDSMEFIKFLLDVEKATGIKIEEKFWNMKVLKDTAAVAEYIAAKR